MGQYCPRDSNKSASIQHILQYRLVSTQALIESDVEILSNIMMIKNSCVFYHYHIIVWMWFLAHEFLRVFILHFVCIKHIF